MRKWIFQLKGLMLQKHIKGLQNTLKKQVKPSTLIESL